MRLQVSRLQRQLRLVELAVQLQRHGLEILVEMSLHVPPPVAESMLVHLLSVRLSSLHDPYGSK